MAERTSSEIEVQSYRGSRWDGQDLDDEWVRSMVSLSQREFSEFQSNCDAAEALAAGRFRVPGPSDFDKLRLPSLYLSLRASVLHLSAGRIDIGVKDRGIDAEGDERAERIERFLENAHHALDVRFPCNEENLYQLGKYGVAIRKIGVNNEALGELPSYDGYDGSRAEWMSAVKSQFDKRISVFPFYQTTCDPRQVMWDHVSARPRWLIWRREVETSWLIANCPEWRNDNQGGGMTTLTEIWTDTQYALWADDKFAKRPIRHPLGMIPFVIMHEVNNDPGVDAKPHDVYQSRLLMAKPLIEWQSQLMSILLMNAQNTAVPVPVVKGDGSDVEDFVTKLKANPRIVQQMPRDAELIHTPVADAPRAVESLVGHMDELMSEMLFSARSQTGGNAQSGYQLSLQNHLHNLNLIGMKNGMERGIVQMNAVILALVERWIRGPVSMFGSTWRGKQQAVISGQDLRGQYDTICEVNADTPEEQSRKYDMGMKASSSGWVSSVMSYKIAGLPQPQRAYDELLRQRVVESEPVMGALSAQLADQVLAEGLEEGVTGAPGDEITACLLYTSPSPRD